MIEGMLVDGWVFTQCALPKALIMAYGPVMANLPEEEKENLKNRQENLYSKEWRQITRAKVVKVFPGGEASVPTLLVMQDNRLYEMIIDYVTWIGD